MGVSFERVKGSNIWTIVGGGGSPKKLAVIGASWKTLRAMKVSEGMDAVLIVLSTMGRALSRVVEILGL